MLPNVIVYLFVCALLLYVMISSAVIASVIIHRIEGGKGWCKCGRLHQMPEYPLFTQYPPYAWDTTLSLGISKTASMYIACI